LQEWSEKNIPPLLVVETETGDKFNPMTGRVLTEDRISFGGDGRVMGREKPDVFVGQTETLPEIESSQDGEGPPTLEELRAIEVTDLGGAVLGGGPGEEDLEEPTRLNDPISRHPGHSLDDVATRIEPAGVAPEEDWEDAATRLEDPAELKARILKEEAEGPGPEQTESAELDTEPEFEGVDEVPIVDTDKEVGGPHSVALSEVSVPPNRPVGLDASLPLAVPGTGSLGPGIVDGATLTEDADGVGAMGDGPTQMLPEEEIVGFKSAPGGDDPTRLMPDGPGSPLDTAPALPSSALPSHPVPAVSPPPMDRSHGGSSSGSGSGGLASAPPMPADSAGLGSETVFSSVGGDGLTDDGTDTTVVHRVAASFLVFALALVVGLGAGSVLFKEELFGESGVVKGLFMGGDETAPGEKPLEVVAPPPVPPPREEPVEENPLAGFNGTTVAFESLMEGTRRLTVSCEGGIRETGRTTVVLATPTVTQCVITALGQGGKRKTVVVQNIRAGLVQCFEGGKTACSD
jgi:hypothetical protein